MQEFDGISANITNEMYSTVYSVIKAITYVTLVQLWYSSYAIWKPNRLLVYNEYQHALCVSHGQETNLINMTHIYKAYFKIYEHFHVHCYGLDMKQIIKSSIKNYSFVILKIGI